MKKENKNDSRDKKKRAAIREEGEEQVCQLKAAFPKGGPYIMIHGDLHLYQKFVSNDNDEKKYRITAILDWETGGFFPWLVERFRDEERKYLGDANFLHPEHTEEEWNAVYPAVKAIWEV